VTHLSGAAFSPARLSLRITHRGLQISGAEGVQPEYVVFDRNFEKAPMGLPGIESLSPGGLPVGKNYLVWMPSSLMPPDFVRPVVAEAQKEGHAILMALSSVDTDSIGEWISETGLSRKGLIDRGLLQIVDWYGQKSAKVLGMEMDDGMIRTSRDLTHLGVGIDMALRKIGNQSPATALMEIHSQAIRLFDMRSLYSFSQSVNAKLTEKGYTAFMLMERNAHDGTINAAMEEMFDGIIDIRSSGGNLEIAIISIRGSHLQPEYRTLTKMRDKLTVDVSKRIPEQSAGGEVPGHGLAARLKELETELERTVGQKATLEKRLAEMAEKENEYRSKHDQMRAAMQEIEQRMAAEKEEADSTGAIDTGHRAEMARLLKVMDDMLEKLPEDVIESFAKSEDFKLYEKIIRLYLEEGK
jgi:KaiC/GvpD/RAD55 family RecA-like ATPase